MSAKPDELKPTDDPETETPTTEQNGTPVENPSG